MTEIETLKSSIKLCMFDQYGTVVDMQGGLARRRRRLPQGEGLAGRSQRLRHLVAAHPLRELDDRRAAAPRAHALSRDRPSVGPPGHGSRRHRPYRGRGALPRRRHRAAAAAFPKSPRRSTACSTRYKLVVLSNGDPDMLEAAKQYHGIPFDRGDLGRRGQCLQAASRDVRNGGAKNGRARWTKSCSSRTTSSTASAPRPPACAPSSSTAAAGRSRRWPHQPDLIVASMTELADLLS